jgi:S1-C subfamily serine protease
MQALQIGCAGAMVLSSMRAPGAKVAVWRTLPMPDDRAAATAPTVVEPLLLACLRVSTFVGEQALTNASGFLFEREQRLYLVTSRHVVIDEPSQHFPDRLEIELHTDAHHMAESTGFSMLLYEDGKSVWHQGRDGAGEIDVAVVEIDRQALPPTMVHRAFTPAHLPDLNDVDVEVGRPLLIVGFPLGFHDTLHHLPVARQAIIASSFGIRFQGEGYFLTDARTHRGTSGAPVVMRLPAAPGATAHDDLPWALLGVHSARLDMGNRDLEADESLGLNCAWYADILMTLTDPAATRAGSAGAGPAAAPSVAPAPATGRR